MKIFELIYRIERNTAIEQLFVEGYMDPTEDQIGSRMILNIILNQHDSMPDNLTNESNEML